MDIFSTPLFLILKINEILWVHKIYGTFVIYAIDEVLEIIQESFSSDGL